MRASGGEARPGSGPVGALVVTVEGELCWYTDQEGTEVERREQPVAGGGSWPGK